MEMSLQTLLSWQFILFCLGIAALTFVVRKVVEFILDNPKVPASKTSKFWTELFLPVLPIILGLILAILAKQYPYPMTDSASGLVRGFFGAVAGMFSGLIYRIMSGMLKSKLPENDNNMTTVVLSKDVDTVMSQEDLNNLAKKVKETINQ